MKIISRRNYSMFGKIHIFYAIRILQRSINIAGNLESKDSGTVVKNATRNAKRYDKEDLKENL